jgi:hypothetical protein
MPQTVRLGEVEQRLSSKYQKLSGLLPKSVDRFPYFYVYPQLEEVVVNQTRSR